MCSSSALAFAISLYCLMELLRLFLLRTIIIAGIITIPLRSIIDSIVSFFLFRRSFVDCIWINMYLNHFAVSLRFGLLTVFIISLCVKPLLFFDLGLDMQGWCVFIAFLSYISGSISSYIIVSIPFGLELIRFSSLYNFLIRFITSAFSLLFLLSIMLFLCLIALAKLLFSIVLSLVFCYLIVGSIL